MRQETYPLDRRRYQLRRTRSQQLQGRTLSTPTSVTEMMDITLTLHQTKTQDLLKLSYTLNYRARTLLII